MTEQTVPFGGTAVAEPPAPVVPLDGEDTTADAGNRRKLLLVGAAVGVLVLAIAAFFLLNGGSSSSNSASSFVVPHHVVPHAVASAPAQKPLALPQKFTGTVGRDPFKPLYVAPAASGSGAKTGTSTGSSTGTTTTSSTGTTTTSSTSGSTGTTSTTSPTGTSTATAPTYRPIWIKVDSIWPKSAVFSVGYSNGSTLKSLRYRVYYPKPGSTTVFAGVFALLGSSNGQVALQYGDGTPFVLDMTHNFMVVS